MAKPMLRVYHGPETKKAKAARAADKVEVVLGDVLPVLAEAMQSGRHWVADFESEEITISTDLYEVILAYQHYRRPSA